MSRYSYTFSTPAGPVEVHFSSDNRVFWSSDWAKLNSIVDAGHLIRKYHGPETFGAVDYFLPGEDD